MYHTPRRSVVTLGISSRQPSDHPQRRRAFARALKRLERELRSLDFDGSFCAWKEFPSGSPTHKDAPFAFKPFCLDEERKDGGELVLWLDASVHIKKPLDPLFETIEKDGYLLYREDHSAGEYCKDEALATLGISREKSFDIPSIWACAIGLDLRNERSIEFLSQWLRLAKDGVTFPGPKWSGVRGFPHSASADPRVKGHRYDQTAASVIAWKLGMTHLRSKEEFAEFFVNKRASCPIVGGLSLSQGLERLGRIIRKFIHA